MSTFSTATLTPSTTSVLGAGAVAEHYPSVARRLHDDVLTRAGDPGYQWWLTHVMSAAGCSNPVRLRLNATWHDGHGGAETERVTDDMPDGLVYVACKNRRASVCPSCAETYRQDTYHLVKAGLLGGKGVPESVTGHPCFFVTLTAPAFGPVHSRVVGANGKVKPCRVRRSGTVCEHGKQVICYQRHAEDDPQLGEAICLDCYDYDHQAVWNLHASELWRRTTMTLNRRLGKVAKERGAKIRLSYAKVAEYQRRGVVHYHALIRLDGFDPDDRDAVLAPDPSLTPELVASHIEQAARITSLTTAAHPHNPIGWAIKWGDQIDVRQVRLTPADCDDRGTLTTQAVAAYLAKYATKATEVTGVVSRRLTAADAAAYAQLDTHQTRQLLSCWRLGKRPLNCTTDDDITAWEDSPGSNLPGWGKLQKWAHMLGFGGHFSTKSRRYSTTLGALRAVRRAYQRGETPPDPDQSPADADPVAADPVVTLNWIFDGVGWLTIGDAALANTAAAKARERRQIAKEETEETLAS
ncbi:replication initiator [Prauserella alba]|uniref:Plasmid replication initiator protein n=1 Tax=Prauserella alba TaxID=176898 RepID=A0ABN1VSF3_9PSEU|nr:replication initiator [Prauserella alba]MCP2183378.1 hypothetical protein [Prauserella alba]